MNIFIFNQRTIASVIFFIIVFIFLNNNITQAQNKVIGQWENEKYDDVTIVLIIRDDGSYSQKWLYNNGDKNTYQGDWKIVDNDLVLSTYYPENQLILKKYFSINTELKQIIHYKNKFNTGQLYYMEDFSGDEVYNYVKSEEEIQMEYEMEEEEKRQDELLNDYIYEGSIFYMKEDYKQAINNFEKALGIDVEVIEQFKDDLINSYSALAKNYLINKRFLESKNLYLKAKEISENNLFDDEIYKCDEGIFDSISNEAEILFNKKNYTNALYSYLEASKYILEGLSPDRFKRIYKKIASCYEKLGDELKKTNSLEKSLTNYNKSLEYCKSMRVQKKIRNVKDDIKYIENQRYKVSLGLLGCISTNNKSSNQFDEIYKSSIGAIVTGEYKVYRFIKAGISLQYSRFENKDLMKLLFVEGIDTSKIEFNTSNVSDQGNLDLIRYSISFTAGYFEGYFNPFVICKMDVNSINIESINYLEEVPNSGGAYTNKYITRKFSAIGYSLGGGLYIGSEKYKFNFNILKSWIDGKGVMEDFNNIEISAGVLINLKI